MARSKDGHVTAMAYVLFDGARPYLFDARWRACWEPSLWLFDLRSQNVARSAHTQRDYAYIVGDLISWCEREGKFWYALTTPEMVDYFESFATTDEVQNKRLGVIYDFYLWAESRGVVRQVPFELREKRNRSSRRAARRRVGAWGKGHRFEPVLIKNRRSRWAPLTITVPSIAEAWKFRDAMPCDRYAMMVEVFMFTGLRVSEVVSLSVKTVTELQTAETNRSCWVKVCGKGQKDRLVPFPRALIHRLQKWVTLQKCFGARKEASAAALFASQRGTLTSRAVQKMFRKRSLECGLAIHPHALRHFFAVHYLKYLQDKNDPSPLEQVRQVLGHNSLETTQRYLHLTDKEKLMIAEDHGSFIAAVSGGRPMQHPGVGTSNAVTAVARYEFQHSISRG